MIDTTFDKDIDAAIPQLRHTVGDVIEGRYMILGITNICKDVVTYFVSVTKGLKKGETLTLERSF